MRLLQRLPSGEIGLTRNLRNDAIPRYAILSHRWGSKSEEVTFGDMVRGTGSSKPGYQKITFCGEQAAKDDLQYFWVDSCCIDKSNKAELQDAISSMFRWYRRSSKCYVYLSDVSNENTQGVWEQAFRESGWFTRGWTLQELLAPTSVEFFSRSAERLGDRKSLEQQIHEVTGIPYKALRGEPLSEFSVTERLSWVGIRETEIEEDLAYSLLGIFGVNLPLRYSEGRVTAFARLEKEIEKSERCLRDLRLNDPYHHKKHIEQIKGGLLESSYRWILDNHIFQTWYNCERSQLLWIKGDPGKGKTMLLCGIINDLTKLKVKTALLSYFFCVATDSRLNNATAVLRGLLYMLLCQQPSLVSHMRKRYDYAGKALFEDSDAWFALAEIFSDILEDPNLENTYLVIDALDECVAADLSNLLEFIVKKSSLSSRVKWLVSSRNWPPVEEQMAKATNKLNLWLELNTDCISEAVSNYTRHKVDQLALDGRYSDKTKDLIFRYLSSNADNTFLWVALVYENLKSTPQAIISTRLNSFPPGLDSLYGRMMQQICNSKDSAICKGILALAATIYEPVRLSELASLEETLEESSDDISSLQEVVSLCGSFLVVRDQVVYFVHQSARDYLLTKAFTEIFPFGKKAIHRKILLKSLTILSRRLRRNVYNLSSPGCSIEEVQLPAPDPLAALRYSCLYWIDHFCDAVTCEHSDTELSLQGGELVTTFIREKYLQWLEAVSLCRSLSKAISAIKRLEDFVQGTGATTSLDLVHDARRFLLYHRQAIETSPLQSYVSGLVFSPTASLIRYHFNKEAPRWITMKPSVEDQWSTCLQTLESHSGTINSVTFSHDSKQLASGSDDQTVKIWDPSIGTCLQTLKGHNSFVSSVVFFYDSKRLASGSGDGTIKIWDVISGICLRTLKGHSGFVSSVSFSQHLRQLVSASDDCTIKVWDAVSGVCLQTLEGHSSTVSSVSFSHSSRWLASGSHDCTVKLWSANMGICLHTLAGHSDIINSVAFSHDSTRLASASDDRTIRVWDSSSGLCIQALSADRSGFANSVTFSYSSEYLISASNDRTVRVWDLNTGTCFQVLEGHSGTVTSIAFSHDSMRFVSASHDRTVRIWDFCGGTRQVLDINHSDIKHSDVISALAFSPGLDQLASASYDRTIKIWDVDSGACVQTLEVDHNDTIDSLAFLPNSMGLTSASNGRNIRTWNASSNAHLRRCGSGQRCDDAGNGNNIDTVKLPTFVHNPSKYKLASDSMTARVYNVSPGSVSPQPTCHSTDSEPFQRCPSRSSVFNEQEDVPWHVSNPSVLSEWEDVPQHVDDSLGFSETEDVPWIITGQDPQQTLSILALYYNTLVNFSTSMDEPPASAKSLTGPLRVSGQWITYKAKKLLWLPPEYRPSCFIVSGSLIAIGVGSGKVWWCSIETADIDC